MIKFLSNIKGRHKFINITLCTIIFFLFVYRIIYYYICHSNVYPINYSNIYKKQIEILHKLSEYSLSNGYYDVYDTHHTHRNLLNFVDSKQSSLYNEIVFPTKKQIKRETSKVDASNFYEMSDGWSIDMYYLGYIINASFGKLGVFLLNGDNIALKQGDLIDSVWCLVSFDDCTATFQNIKFQYKYHNIDSFDLVDSINGYSVYNNF